MSNKSKSLNDLFKEVYESELMNILYPSPLRKACKDEEEYERIKKQKLFKLLNSYGENG